MQDSNSYTYGMTQREINEASDRLFKSVMAARGILSDKPR